MNRRGFLALLGIGAASPAVDALSPNVGVPTAAGDGVSAVGSAFSPAQYMAERRSALSVFRTSREAYEAMRERAVERVSWRDPRHLDPDIARHRAWSDNFKCLKQRERDIERMIAEMTREEPLHLKLARLGLGALT